MLCVEMYATFIVTFGTIIFTDTFGDNMGIELDGNSYWDVYCKLQPNSYDCGGKGQFTHRFYYDIKMDDCKSFTFGTCPHNYNYFSTISSCQDTCKDAGPRILTRNLTEANFCRLQPDFGWCQGYHPSWYFDVSERTCKGFSYSGCGGNMNRFPSAQICAGVCSTNVKY